MNSIWKSAQLFIGFYRDKAGRGRKTPHCWPPKCAFAGLASPPDEQETFVLLRAASGNDDEDVQIKLHPDKIILRRSNGVAWSGLVVGASSVRVHLDDLVIRIGADGAIIRETEAETTHIEADGSILRKTPAAEVSVSADSSRIVRRTDDDIAVIADEGFMRKRKS